MALSKIELADRITELVSVRWQEQGVPLLLSELGTADKGSIGESAKKVSTNLADFIRNHAADRTRIVSRSDHPLVLAAMPANVEQDVDVDSLLARISERSAARGPRFHSAFWAAFRVPLEEDRRRFVAACAPFRFEDVASTETVRSGYVEVERQYVARVGTDASDVERRIAEWLASNGLSREIFLASKKTNASLPPNDFLGRLLTTLEPDDLRRMNVPLDIVYKLRRLPFS